MPQPRTREITERIEHRGVTIAYIEAGLSDFISYAIETLGPTEAKALAGRLFAEKTA